VRGKTPKPSKGADEGLKLGSELLDIILLGLLAAYIALRLRLATRFPPSGRFLYWGGRVLCGFAVLWALMGLWIFAVNANARTWDGFFIIIVMMGVCLLFGLGNIWLGKRVMRRESD
jgi:hypothetical protein